MGRMRSSCHPQYEHCVSAGRTRAHRGAGCTYASLSLVWEYRPPFARGVRSLVGGGAGGRRRGRRWRWGRAGSRRWHGLPPVFRGRSLAHTSASPARRSWQAQPLLLVIYASCGRAGPQQFGQLQRTAPCPAISLGGYKLLPQRGGGGTRSSSTAESHAMCSKRVKKEVISLSGPRS